MTNGEYYDDEINLREMLSRLLQHWWWIVIGMILAAGIALVLSLWQPKTYKASAYVALTKSDVNFQFDPRIRTVVEIPTGTGIQHIAVSDEVMQAVMESQAAATIDPDKKVVDQFRDRFSSTLTDTLLNLSVIDTDPGRAALLANSWADILTQRLNMIYAPTSLAQDQYETQRNDALGQWEAAQQALVEFQKGNPERILNHKLAAEEEILATYSRASLATGIALQDASILKARLESRESDIASNLNNDLVVLLLTVQSLISNSGEDSSGPLIDLQVQLPGASLLSLHKEDQALYLAELIDSLRSQEIFLSSAADNVQDRIYDLQEKLARALEDRSQLELERNLAQEAYQAIARKTAELQFSSSDQDTVARVASSAVTPSEIVSPRVSLNIAIAIMLGFVLSLFAVLFYDWWKVDEKILEGDNPKN